MSTICSLQKWYLHLGTTVQIAAMDEPPFQMICVGVITSKRIWIKQTFGNLKLSAMKRREWIIKVYSRLAGPVLECEGGAVLHFLFKCIKVSILGKCISVTAVHAIWATTTKRTHLTCITHTQRFFSWLYPVLCYPMWHWPIKTSEEWLPLTHDTHTT